MLVLWLFYVYHVTDKYVTDVKNYMNKRKYIDQSSKVKTLQHWIWIRIVSVKLRCFIFKFIRVQVHTQRYVYLLALPIEKTYVWWTLLRPGLKSLSIISPKKNWGFLREMADSKHGAGVEERGTSWPTRK